jgi:hypothetical protein
LLDRHFIPYSVYRWLDVLYLIQFIDKGFALILART